MNCSLNDCDYIIQFAWEIRDKPEDKSGLKRASIILRQI